MENNVVENGIVKELSQKYKRKEKIVLKMFQVGIECGYCINEIERMIAEFESNDNCY